MADNSLEVSKQEERDRVFSHIVHDYEYYLELAFRKGLDEALISEWFLDDYLRTYGYEGFGSKDNFVEKIKNKLDRVVSGLYVSLVEKGYSSESIKEYFNPKIEKALKVLKETVEDYDKRQKHKEAKEFILDHSEIMEDIENGSVKTIVNKERVRLLKTKEKELKNDRFEMIDLIKQAIVREEDKILFALSRKGYSFDEIVKILYPIKIEDSKEFDNIESTYIKVDEKTKEVREFFRQKYAELVEEAKNKTSGLSSEK